MPAKYLCFFLFTYKCAYLDYFYLQSEIHISLLCGDYYVGCSFCIYIRYILFNLCLLKQKSRKRSLSITSFLGFICIETWVQRLATRMETWVERLAAYFRTSCSTSGSFVVMKSTLWLMNQVISLALFTVQTFVFKPSF